MGHRVFQPLLCGEKYINHRLCPHLQTKKKNDDMVFDIATTQETSDCYENAISIIHPHCDSISNLPPIKRKLATVRLVICELEESAVSTPPSCLGVTESSLSPCIQALERSPQWWATYTSYFKHINDICHQYLVPLERNILLEQYRDSYSNLTTLVHDVGHHLDLVIRSHRVKSKEIVDWTVNELFEQYNEAMSTFPQNMNDAVKCWLDNNLPDLIDNQINKQLETLMAQVQHHMETTISNTIILVFVHEIDVLANHLNNSIEAYASQLHGHVLKLEGHLERVSSHNVFFQAISIVIGIANLTLQNWYLLVPVLMFMFCNRFLRSK